VCHTIHDDITPVEVATSARRLLGVRVPGELCAGGVRDLCDLSDLAGSDVQRVHAEDCVEGLVVAAEIEGHHLFTVGRPRQSSVFGRFEYRLGRSLPTSYTRPPRSPSLATNMVLRPFGG
jgi:hypothetical protein